MPGQPGPFNISTNKVAAGFAYSVCPRGRTLAGPPCLGLVYITAQFSGLILRSAEFAVLFIVFVGYIYVCTYIYLYIHSV